MKHLQTLEIPKYITKVETSKKRRKRYYKQTDGKWKPRTLPKTYKEKLEKGIWTQDSRGYVRDEDGKKIVANPIAAGTPNTENLSGNRFYSGMHHRIRIACVEGLQEFYTPFVEKQLEPFKMADLPLIVKWEFHTTLRGAGWDMDNMSFYWKYLQDTLTDCEKLPEDDVAFITWPPGPKFVPVDNWKERKFIIKFYKDERNIIQQVWKSHNLLKGHYNS